MRTSLWKVGYVLAFALSSAIGTGLLAQSQPSASAEPPVPTIRVNTRLVLVDVVVSDKSGKSVQGLKAEDFTLQEKGKNQKIAFFTSAAEKQAQAAAAPQLPPGIYSNKPEYRSPGGPISVIVLDAANTPFKDQAYARLQMLQFVREQYRPGQRTAVLTLTSSLGVLQDFTEDSDILLQALQKYRPQEQESSTTILPRPPSTSSDRGVNSARAADGMAQRIQAFQDIQTGYIEERRIQITLEGMRSLARFLGGIPGRKSVIWVTASFPFSIIPENKAVTDAEMSESLPSISQLSLGTRASGTVAAAQRSSHLQEIRETAAQLSSAQVAIYPVDARGLVSGMEATMADLPSRRFKSMDDSALGNISDVTASQETMKEMARETGGLAYVNQNEIKKGVATAMDDSLAFYTVGYYPEDKKWDGRYRTIKVKVNRDGLESRYRKGYFAIDSTDSKDRKPEQEVAEALQGQAPATLVTFSAQIKPNAKGVGVDFLVDPSTVSAEEISGGRKKVTMALYAAMFGPDGKMLGNRSMKVDEAFDTETYQKILQQGMLLHIDLDQPVAKGNEVRMAIRDNRTGNIGTLAAPASPGQ